MMYAANDAGAAAPFGKRGRKRVEDRGIVSRMRRTVLAALILAAFIAPASHATAAVTVPGVDVSHWQGSIDWTAVATDPQDVRFAVLKATAGRTYTDPSYAANLGGALSNGIAVLAYHFAYPDADPGDALAEADHFVNTAALVDGRVIPALDLETAGLAYWPHATPAQLLTWARTWLDEVLARTGIHAMVYTNPSFWQKYFANTSVLAQAGYPLWIAHWYAASPSVPASDWDGKGWRAWQYSSTGHVAGVATPVDLDRLDPASLAQGL
jgi:GH25 family lysozyme M1 (1,4-beta-N-acetylmuramidase)